MSEQTREGEASWTARRELVTVRGYALGALSQLVGSPTPARPALGRPAMPYWR